MIDDIDQQYVFLNFKHALSGDYIFGVMTISVPSVGEKVHLWGASYVHGIEEEEEGTREDLGFFRVVCIERDYHQVHGMNAYGMHGDQTSVDVYVVPWTDLDENCSMIFNGWAHVDPIYRDTVSIHKLGGGNWRFEIPIEEFPLVDGKKAGNGGSFEIKVRKLSEE